MSKPDLNGKPRLTRSQRRRLQRQRLFEPSPAVQVALAEAEQKWATRSEREYRLLDAVDEHRSLGLLGPCTAEQFDRTVELDLQDWLDRPLASLGRIMLTARYTTLWKLRQTERAKLLLQVFNVLRRGAVFRHPEIDFGPDPFAFQPGDPLNLKAGAA